MIQEFLNDVIARHRAGDATEHSYRPALAKLFESLNPDVSVTNEARRVTDAGSPDFTFRREDQSRGFLTIGHCECKDVGFDVRHPAGYSKEQKERYLEAFPNLLYTNGFEWVFYRDHNPKPIAEIRIADLMGPTPLPENFAELEERLKEFVGQTPVSISTSKDLAARMAAKAKLIRFVFNNELKRDKDFRTELGQQFQVFKDKLIHDITLADFAGIYAETIAYGLFAARLQDTKTPKDFSREEAYELLPRSIPFLRNLFQFIARRDLDEGLVRVIDDLVEIFLVSEPWEIMKNYGKSTARNDPFLHFYEDFLAAYDKKKRKARGVWYTPEPVVDFIVRAVDDVLKTEFGLPLGLADTSKTTIRVEQQRGLTKAGAPAKRAEYFEQEVHRVQILDPAAGTGTFLAHAIKHIADTVKTHIGPGAWDGYVEKDLIPRLHGFELLMASYAMCHLKLDIELKATGYTPTSNPPRASVFLTNSLEEGEPPQPVLMLEKWLADEAREANRIKTEKPIMVVIGNPPYSGISQNMGEWISDLIEDYKYVDGVHFGERKHWLHDDYVKFIRLAEKMIEKNGEGVLGFISNHGYLDNPTFRGMRWHLLKTFDKIYVLDLHGNSKKTAVSPDGSIDKNVFDIQQGVAIIIGVKHRDLGAQNGLAEVFRGDLWGARKEKYEALWAATLEGFDWTSLDLRGPLYSFVERDWCLLETYQRGFAVNEFMPSYVTGIISMGDGFAIAETSAQLNHNYEDLTLGMHTNESFGSSYKVGESYSKWILKNRTNLAEEKLAPVAYCYRPFDKRVTYFDNRILWRWRFDVMKHMLAANIGLVFCRQTVSDNWSHSLVASCLVDDCFISNRTKERGYVAPLYLYPDQGDLDQSRRVNFDPKLYREMCAKAELDGEHDGVAEAVFDFIYGVLHCPMYRETYAEFLKIDFPRIPWPESPEQFRNISAKGNQLRQLHLMDPAAVGEARYPLHGDGDMRVAPGFPKFEVGANGLGEVFINDEQRFVGAPEVSWGFWIGGYQPAQKWLKDRRGRELSTDDLIHYQRILKILSETDKIMRTITMDLPT
tara:strand:+ start:196 stop:3372 length:3177 start_codon:yes stop_codon:yes gene_type:complete